VAAWIFVINAYFLEGIAIYAFQKKGLTKSMFTLLKQPNQFQNKNKQKNNEQKIFHSFSKGIWIHSHREKLICRQLRPEHSIQRKSGNRGRYAWKYSM
jgi:hypothetical protein